MNIENRKNIFQRLKEIEKRDGGLTAEAALKDAKNPKSPLHSACEWDDKKAAHIGRLAMMQSLIVSFDFQRSETTESRTVPYYVRDPSLKGDQPGYRSLISIRDNRADSLALLADEFRRIEALLVRLEGIAEVLGLKEKISPVVQDVRNLRHGLQLPTD